MHFFLDALRVNSNYSFSISISALDKNLNYFLSAAKCWKPLKAF